MKARPGIEPWLATATNEQRIAMDEFISVLAGDFDAGSVDAVLQVLTSRISKETLISLVKTL